jgi:hypothetical protein
MKVTVWFPTEGAGFIRFAVKLLRSLGYRVSTKVLGSGLDEGSGRQLPGRR